ncbi:branched-subunit amino acid transport protein [Melghirimyces profundicolus]|uniref:Branched-subunit amino acid transport protein n=1 Tax=Melghirimyces profundicolus TaxID=1242148 RepID=A0A2T6C0I8_9BACL|nr:AzlD domain-containing protein [Melghirimyces profundicolus]PTX61757.1 branched-subunit amino acid transport protein [Melghirimyces profundicolus]
MTLLWILLGMSAVTMVPRWLPVWLVGRWKMPRWIRRWLNSIPFAALGALIFPGILSVEPDTPSVGLIGGLVAAILAFFRLHVLFVIAGAILTVVGMKGW